MATVNRTVESSGGDFTSLSAWEASRQADLVAAGDIEQAECFGFQDTAVLVVDGWTTDASNYPRAYATAGAEAQSPYNTDGTAYRLEPGVNITPVDVLELYFRIEHIQVKLLQGTSARNGIRFQSGGNGGRAVACYALCDQNGQTSGSTGMATGVSGGGAPPVFFINGIADGFRSSGFFSTSGSGRAFHYYCDAPNTGDGASAGDGFFGGSGRIVKNCIGFGSDDEDYEPAYAAASTNNASEDTTAPGGSPTTSISDPFVSSTDFHLASGSDVEGQGADLSSDSDFAVSDDFDGVARDGSTPDCGAFEFVATGETVSLGVASATFTGAALTRAVGAITPALGVALATFTGSALTTTQGAVTRTLGTALASYTGSAFTTSFGAVTPALGVALAPFTGSVLGTSLGVVTRNLGPALGTFTGEALSVAGAQTRTLGPALGTFAAQAFTVSFGSVSVSLGVALATWSAAGTVPTVGAFDNEVSGEVVIVRQVEGGVSIVSSLEGLVVIVRDAEGDVEI